MRVRVATTALGITSALLALPACSTESAGDQHPSAARAGTPSGSVQETAVLSSSALESRLLDPSDLGSGYLPEPERPAQHDDVTVLGCPALSELGGDAATGGPLAFPRRAKADFTYGGTSSAISEELYSDSAKKLSDGTGRIFDAMTGCPTYQVISGGTLVDVTSQKLTAPDAGGDQQWSQLLTFTAAGRSSVVKQTAVRDGNLLVVVSGFPALVDRHLDRPSPRPRQRADPARPQPAMLPSTAMVGGSIALLADALRGASGLARHPGMDLVWLDVEHVRVVTVRPVAAGRVHEQVRTRWNVPVPEPGVLLPPGVAPGHDGL
ncbi:hypothetical protein FHS42_005733 [Streptomyces zagrosensis]|uniref:Lipoprotein n=1 Tax=Streptomyces zagrosensis TaxID=1042984 RepID=A0A7W9QET1_9ACTN|nr:hypothetical protein [Streptomyces zagrosensis]